MKKAIRFCCIQSDLVSRVVRLHCRTVVIGLVILNALHAHFLHRILTYVTWDILGLGSCFRRLHMHRRGNHNWTNDFGIFDCLMY